MNVEGPRLIDNSSKYYLYNKLAACHETRVKYHSIILNVLVFMVFAGVFGGVLYYCYKKKPTIQQSRSQMERDQQFILSKIRFYQEQRQEQRQAMTAETAMNHGRGSEITGLPST